MIALIIISFIRQILGTGELSAFGTKFFTLPVLGEHPLIFFVLPPGAFLVISMLLVLFRKVGVLKK
jgi:Na+-translocating ferredoxin:NAD+ oxidoreductase RnfE subunit